MVAAYRQRVHGNHVCRRDHLPAQQEGPTNRKVDAVHLATAQQTRGDTEGNMCVIFSVLS
jgi:hypothetical protein